MGKLRVAAFPAGPGWAKQLIGDWKVSPDDLPQAFDQLNRGQAAEVVNGDGVPLRLWVDPSKKGRGVEPLVKKEKGRPPKRDYLRIG